jgi:hypothetical protein
LRRLKEEVLLEGSNPPPPILRIGRSRSILLIIRRVPPIRFRDCFSSRKRNGDVYEAVPSRLSGISSRELAKCLPSKGLL